MNSLKALNTILLVRLKYKLLAESDVSQLPSDAYKSSLAIRKIPIETMSPLEWYDFSLQHLYSYMLEIGSTKREGSQCVDVIVLGGK